ncbi:hypothetical protein [Streptomyces sp. NPDC054863]
MAQQDVQGTVAEAQPNNQFRIELDNGHVVTGYKSARYPTAGNVAVGDKVTVRIEPTNPDRGIIVARQG